MYRRAAIHNAIPAAGLWVSFCALPGSTPLRSMFRRPSILMTSPPKSWLRWRPGLAQKRFIALHANAEPMMVKGNRYAINDAVRNSCRERRRSRPTVDRGDSEHIGKLRH